MVLAFSFSVWFPFFLLLLLSSPSVIGQESNKKSPCSDKLNSFEIELLKIIRSHLKELQKTNQNQKVASKLDWILTSLKLTIELTFEWAT